MKIRRIAGLLWLLSAMVAARDPFAPPVTARCEGKAAELNQWRLQGVIGRSGDFRGWLRSPQGQSLRVMAHSPFPVAPWQVDDIGPQSISLRTASGCGEQHFSLQLKGRAYEKDSDRHAVADDRLRPRQ